MEKVAQLMEHISRCLDAGRYLDTRHAADRQNDRAITRPEVLQVLRRGHHEKRKDRFEAQYQAWNYSIRGRTIDLRELRVIVSFDKDMMLVITAIDFNL
jgi:hypothetical protein